MISEVFVVIIFCFVLNEKKNILECFCKGISVIGVCCMIRIL